MVQDYAEILAQRGVDVEHARIDWNRMANDMLPLAERRVHARLLLDAIADAESVQVSEEEFERALAVLGPGAEHFDAGAAAGPRRGRPAGDLAVAAPPRQDDPPPARGGAGGVRRRPRRRPNRRA